MNTINLSKEKITNYVYMALLSIACLLILLIVIGTIAGLFHIGKSEPLIGSRSLPQIQHTQLNPSDIRVFSEMGRLRIPLINSSILILSISFPYSADDTAFTEEILAKVSDFRTIASGYFSSLPETRLIQIDEDAAKQEILRRFNDSLRLGRIEVLYFNDLMVIESY
ncbi:MAG: hypothetical protein FWD24_04000 [Treponema sp.]|nr:hypothetical protein [Treponema sp.]